MEKNLISQSHDLFFKVAFTHKEVVFDFINAFFGAENLEELDLTSLELINNPRIGTYLSELRADVVYRVKFRNKDKYLYLPFRPQGKVEPLLRSRMMSSLAIMDELDLNYEFKQGTTGNSRKAVDIIFFIIYNGLQKLEWPPKPKSSAEMRDFILKFSKEVFLVNLQKMTSEELLEFGKAALFFILLKEKAMGDFENFLKNSDVLGKLINESPYWEWAMIYLLNDMKGDEKEILSTIKGLNKNKIDDVMGILERRERQGFEKGEKRGFESGKQRGIKIGYKYMIQKFLAIGMSKEEIADRLDIIRIELEEILFLTID